MKRHTVTMIMSKAFSASRGLSWQEKKGRKERDLCRPPTRSFVQSPTTLLVETYWFSKSVSLNVECACAVETLRWKFLSPRLSSRKPVLSCEARDWKVTGCQGNASACVRGNASTPGKGFFLCYHFPLLCEGPLPAEKNCLNRTDKLP